MIAPCAQRRGDLAPLVIATREAPWRSRTGWRSHKPHKVATPFGLATTVLYEVATPFGLATTG